MILKKHFKQKRILVLLLGSLFFVSTYILFFSPTKVQGSEYIIRSINSPGSHPDGLTWDGEYLWNADGDKDKIYMINPEGEGIVVNTFNSPGKGATGLTWDGEYLWNADKTKDKIYKLDPSTGEVVDSFDSPIERTRGITWDGEYLWITDPRYDRLHKIDSSDGTIVSSIDSPGPDPYGLAWDGEFLWNADNNKGEIYKLNPLTGRVVATYKSPGSDPTGLTCVGKYLWNADGNSKTIYQIDTLSLEREEERTKLEIKSISCPEIVERGQEFTIAVTFSNIGYIRANDVTASILLPNEIYLSSGSLKISIGTVEAGQTKIVSWNATISETGETGDFSITVKISSSNAEIESITETIHVESDVTSLTSFLTKTTLGLMVGIFGIIGAGAIVGVIIALKKGLLSKRDAS